MLAWNNWGVVGIAERGWRRLAGTAGQASVELAVTLPLMLLILLGTVDLGRVYHASISTANGARAGVQYASSSPAAAGDVTGVQNAVAAEMGTLADIPGGNPVVTLNSAADASGYLQATVAVAYTFRTLVPWPAIPSEIRMARQVSMRVVQ